MEADEFIVTYFSCVFKQFVLEGLRSGRISQSTAASAGQVD
jgi:hypothetical protein